MSTQPTWKDGKVLAGAFTAAGLALLTLKLFRGKKKEAKAHDFDNPIALEQLQSSYDFIIGKPHRSYKVMYVLC